MSYEKVEPQSDNACEQVCVAKEIAHLVCAKGKGNVMDHDSVVMTVLASIIALFSGVQLFALGIFGEYLARIHFRTMDQPPYVISERCDGSGEEQ